LCRAVSLLCALAFLVFTLAHAAHACGITGSASHTASHVHSMGGDDGPSDDGLGHDKSDDTSKAPVTGHCCACATAMIPSVGPALVAPEPLAQRIAVLRQAPRPHIPPADIRPPIV